MRASAACWDRARQGSLNPWALVGLCLALVALLTLPSTARAVAPDPPYEFGSPVVSQAGPEQTVFDHSTQACQDDDIPDMPARAFKDALGRTQLINTHYHARRELGTTLDNVTHTCGVVLGSSVDSDPANFNYLEWLYSTYTTDGTNVYGFIHQEYHGWDFYQQCAEAIGTPDINKCWYNAVTFASSNDAGNTFSQPAAPSHLLASFPYQFVPMAGPYGIYRPSNVHLRPDGYYYMAAIVVNKDEPEPGVCILRTTDIASPSSWRAWDGKAYTVRFSNPYVETGANPADHICKPVSSVYSGPLRGFEMNSITYNTYYDRWMIVGQAMKNNVPGFYFALSEDLIHWTEPILLMEGEVPWMSHVCGDPDPIRDGSLLDPSSPGLNFEQVDQTANLYFTRFNYFQASGNGCYMTSDRDLIKYPIQFSGQVPTATFTASASQVDIGDWVQFDAAGSTDPDGSIVRYDWDLNGDGTYEVQNVGPNWNTTYSTVRDGEVGLRVWDDQGLQDEIRIPVKIDAQIDFQPAWATPHHSYSKDSGAAYSEARGYGWVREDSLSSPTHVPLDLSANTVDRDPFNTDGLGQKFDTAIFMQYPESGSNGRLVKTPGAFEIAVPCGVYAVTVSAGDSSWSSFKTKPGDVSIHRINAEGETVINDFRPTDKIKVSSATQTVGVCDGRLTIDALGGTNTKLNFVDVRRVNTKIDFQPGWAKKPADYARDTGAAWSDARGYGWVRQDSLSSLSHVPLDLKANTVDRDPYDSDGNPQKDDTTILMQYPAAGSNSRLVNTAGAFEISVPCGTYEVTVRVGDSAYSSLKTKPGDASTHRINVEGVNAISGFVPTDTNKFATATRTVTACDGRLTIDAIGGTNTKLNYVDVARVS